MISTEVLASYAADAAREVSGVRGIVDGARSRHRGVRVSEEGGVLSVALHLGVEWGTDAADVGAAVQRRVADYLSRMSGAAVTSVDVVVDEIGPLAGSS